MATFSGGGSRFGGPLGPAGQDEPDTDDMGGMGAVPARVAPPAQLQFPQPSRRGRKAAAGRGHLPKAPKVFSPPKQRPNQFFGE